MKLFCEIFLHFRSWQHQKRSNSARHPQFSNLTTSKRSNSARLPQFWKLTTSKTKQFCEISFEHGKLSAELTASCQCVLRFFHSICVSAAPATKKWCQVIRSAAPVTQNHLSKPEDLMLQNATLSGNQRPNLLTSLMNMSLVPRLPHEMHLCRASWNVPWLPSFLEMLQNPPVLLTFGKVQNPWRLPHKTTLQRPKVARTCGVFRIFTWKCASHQNGVHLFDISTSKSGPTLRCFVHFDLETCFAPQRRALFWHGNFQKWFVHFDFAMCFAPQRHALFRHLNFQKCSERGVLRATTACNFSSLIWPGGSAPTALASLLFNPPGPQIMRKTQGIATFHLFAHLHLLSSDSFSSLIFSLLLFSSLSLPTSAFPSVHIVGSLSSKFPSMIHAVISRPVQVWSSHSSDIKTSGQVDAKTAGLLRLWTAAQLNWPCWNKHPCHLYLWPFWLVFFLTFWKSLEFHWKPSAGGFPRIPAASTPWVFPSGLKALPARSVLRDPCCASRFGPSHLDFKSIISIHISYHISTINLHKSTVQTWDFIEITIWRTWSWKGKHRKTKHFPPEIVACGQRAAQKPVWSLESPPAYQSPGARIILLLRIYY